jgi:hypothetical protein
MHGFFLQIEVTAGFALSHYLPPGGFMRFSVLCHRHEPDDYDHWQDGFYMKFDDVLIHSSVSSAHKCGTLKVGARAPKNQLDALWRIVLILLQVCLLSFRRLVADMDIWLSRCVFLLIHTQEFHNLSTRCVRNRLVASLSTSCNNVVILSSCYKVVIKLLNCRSTTVANCQQGVDNLSTSWD